MKMRQMSKQRSSGTKSASLTPEELQEYGLRWVALRAARHNAMMVQEAHDAWLRGKIQERGLKGEYGVDLKTGELTNG